MPEETKVVKQSVEEKYEDLHKTLAAEKVEGSSASCQIEAGSDKWALTNRMSQLAKVCGFITPSDAKQEIVLQKIAGEKGAAPKYKFALAEKMNKKIIGVIISFPEALATAIDAASEKRPTSDLSLEEICAEQAEKVATMYNEGLVTRVFDYAEAIDWICAYCFDGHIREAAEIFSPYTVNVPGKDGQPVTKKNITTIADMGKKIPEYTLLDRANSVFEKYQEAVAEANAATDEATKKKLTSKVNTLKARLNDSTKLWPMKSNYRGTTLAVEGNYIPVEKFVTVDSKAALSKEDADKYADVYVKPLMKERTWAPEGKAATKLTPAQYMEDTTAAAKVFVAGTSIQDSVKAFAADSKHYCGVARPIDAAEIALVKKEKVTVTKEPTKKDIEAGNTTPKTVTKIVVSQIKFGEEGNKFDATGAQAKIVAAVGTDAAELESSVTAFIKKATEKAVKRSAGKGKAIKASSVDRLAMKRLLRNVTESRFEH